MRHARSQFLQPAPLGVLLLAAACLGCPPDQPQSGKKASTPASPKCPEHLVNWVVADSAGELKQIQTVPAAGALASRPEVHDCQRLVLTDGEGTRAYGPLGAIFASERLDSLFAGRAAITGVPLRAAATIYIEPGLPVPGYHPLHLPPAWSCLYLSRTPQPVAAGQWVYEARVMPLKGHAVHECAEPADPARLLPGVLRVAATPLAAVAGLDRADETLSSARWDDDFLRDGKSQHISLRCGEAWCDVLPVDADAPVSYSPPTSLPADVRTSLPGWYDRQLLAVPDPDRPGSLVPGDVHVTYFPARALGEETIDAFAGRWQATGYVVLPSASPHYATKLGLEPGLNTVALLSGAHPGSGPVPKCRPDDQAKHGANPWWARITSSGGVERTFCSYQHVHSASPGDVPLDGIVRWRWLDDDETTWQRCPNGCCPIS